MALHAGPQIREKIPNPLDPGMEGYAQPATPVDLRQEPTPFKILICPGDHPQILLATGLQEETRALLVRSFATEGIDAQEKSASLVSPQ